MSVQALQASPPAAFCRYWCFAMLGSPASAQDSVTRASPAFARKPVGFAGAGSVVVAFASPSDLPSESRNTRTVYCLPGTRAPMTVRATS